MYFQVQYQVFQVLNIRKEVNNVEEIKEEEYVEVVSDTTEVYEEEESEVN